jgi:AcrR family transcriptional regulator
MTRPRPPVTQPSPAQPSPAQRRGTTVRRRLDPDARRAEITTAAKEVFLRIGFSATTFRLIAETAGSSEALLHRYFGSKEEIFEEAVLAPLERLMRDLQEAAEALRDGDSGDLPGRLEHFHQYMLTGVAQLAPYLGVALFEGDTDSKRFYAERVRPLIWSSARALREVLARNGSSNLALPVVVYALYGSYFGVDMNAMLRGREIDVEKVSRQLATLLTQGLRGRRAR